MITELAPGVLRVAHVDERLFRSKTGVTAWWARLFGGGTDTPALLDDAEHILVSHDRLKAAVTEVFGVDPARVTVVGYVAPPDLPTPTDPVSRRITKEVYGNEHSYFYAPTYGGPVDNLPALIAAYTAFRRRVPEPVRLLVAAADHERAARRAARQSPFAEDIVWLPEVSASEQHGLVAAARAVVFPSLSTRFPGPVLAAWSAGVPVLCGDRDVLLGGGAQVQARDVDSIAGALVALVTTPFLASGLVDNGTQRLAAFRAENVRPGQVALLEKLGLPATAFPVFG